MKRSKIIESEKRSSKERKKKTESNAGKWKKGRSNAEKEKDGSKANRKGYNENRKSITTNSIVRKSVKIKFKKKYTEIGKVKNVT